MQELRPEFLHGMLHPSPLFSTIFTVESCVCSIFKQPSFSSTVRTRTHLPFFFPAKLGPHAHWLPHNDDIKPSAPLQADVLADLCALINAPTSPSIYLRQRVTAHSGFISLSRCTVISGPLRKAYQSSFTVTAADRAPLHAGNTISEIEGCPIGLRYVLFECQWALAKKKKKKARMLRSIDVSMS